MKKLRSERTIIDTATGEVVESTKVITMDFKSDPYVMLFGSQLHRLMELSACERNLFDKLLKRSEFNTNVVRITSTDRKQISDMLSIQCSTMNNLLCSLKKKGIISGSRGHFVIDPQLAWKGTLKERVKLL